MTDFNWDYRRNEENVEEQRQYTIIPEGEHNVKIKGVERRESRAHNDMIVLQLEAEGFPRRTLYYYIVFLPDRPEITNRKLTQLFNSFPGIKEGDFDIEHWKGQGGACYVKHEEDHGSTTENVQYLTKRKQQEQTEIEFR